MSFTSNNIDLMGREEQSAMVIRDSRYFQHWTGKHEFNCRFTVTSSLGLGVFAVIQRLSFRRNSKGQCVDYVQVRSLYFVIYLFYFENIIFVVSSLREDYKLRRDKFKN